MNFVILLTILYWRQLAIVLAAVLIGEWLYAHWWRMALAGVGVLAALALADQFAQKRKPPQ